MKNGYSLRCGLAGLLLFSIGCSSNSGESENKVDEENELSTPTGDEPMEGEDPIEGVVDDPGEVPAPSRCSSPSDGSSEIWVNAYYPGWARNRLPVEQINFEGITQLMHFSWVPEANGDIDDDAHGVGPEEAAKVIEAAHEAGKKALISVGGAGYAGAFAQAISAGSRERFVETLVTNAVERGYDGIDIDMEPIEAADEDNFVEFMADLREKVDEEAPELLLTAAGLGRNSRVFGRAEASFDQINVMTYDLAASWIGPRAWHNSPLKGPSSGNFWSAERGASEYEGAGVPKEKIGVGIDFSGYQYLGASDPKQPYEEVVSRIPFREIMTNHFEEEALRWDEEAEAPYLSFPDNYVTYDNEELVQCKVHWVRDKGHGGVIVWEISSAYFPDYPEGERHPLLHAIGEVL